MKYVKLSLVFISLFLIPACAALMQTMIDGKSQYLSKTFSLAPGGSDSLSFPVNMRGRISVSARWKNQDHNLQGLPLLIFLIK
ncbi:MAG: hypothetical protein HYW85_02640 [Deltaproteobacteria bacterium]|nr:hypothetical protein [Deltaproteobacteria bacterium]